MVSWKGEALMYSPTCHQWDLGQEVDRPLSWKVRCCDSNSVPYLMAVSDGFCPVA